MSLDPWPTAPGLDTGGGGGGGGGITQGQADARYLRRSQNLADLADASAAGVLPLEHTPEGPADVFVVNAAVVGPADKVVIQVHADGDGETSHVEVDAAGIAPGVEVQVLTDPGVSGGTIAQRVRYGLPAVLPILLTGYTGYPGAVTLPADWTAEGTFTDADGASSAWAVTIPAGTFDDPLEFFLAVVGAFQASGLVADFDGYEDEHTDGSIPFSLRTADVGELCSITVTDATEGAPLNIGFDTPIDGASEEVLIPVGRDSGPGFGFLGHPLVDDPGPADNNDPEYVAENWGVGTHWSANGMPDEAMHCTVTVLDAVTYNGRTYERWVKWSEAPQRLDTLEAPLAIPGDQPYRSAAKVAGVMADNTLGAWGSTIDALMLAGAGSHEFPRGGYSDFVEVGVIGGTSGRWTMPRDGIIVGLSVALDNGVGGGEDDLIVEFYGSPDSVPVRIARVHLESGANHGAAWLSEDQLLDGTDDNPALSLPAWMVDGGSPLEAAVVSVNGETTEGQTGGTTATGLAVEVFWIPRLGDTVAWPSDWT